MNDRVAYATLVGLVAYAAVATDLYLPAIPIIVEEFGTTVSGGQLTLSAFMLGIAVGQLIFGPLSDFYGRIPVVTIGSMLFILTSVACAFAPSIELMWLARLVQGMAAASGPVIARAIVRDRFHGNRAAQVMSMLGAAMAVVPLIAPTIGSWLLVLVNWRATYIALALFAILVMLGLRHFEESAPAIGVGGIGIVPILRLFSTCLSNRRFIGYQISGVSGYAAILAYLSTVSFIMRDVFALPPAYFGYAFAVSVAGFMVGALICSRLVMRLGLDKTLALGIAITLCAAISQFSLAHIETLYLLPLAGSTFAIFFGIGLSAANSAMGAVSLFPNNAGAASAVYGFTHATLAAATGFLAGQLYDSTLQPTALLMLAWAVLGVMGLPLSRPLSRSSP